MLHVAQLFTRLDVQTGKAQSWCPGDRCFCEELIFVPGPRGDVEEDDGVLLGMVFDGERMRTSLVVRPYACPASALPQSVSSSVSSREQ